MSLGGMRDEAEIRGHRRTYIGAMPGRVISGLKNCDSNNPVIMLDEIDKLGADFRGDPSSALLEVLDPEQNSSFNDHYLGVAFDLSRVLFIATANVLDSIPGPLQDRMEILRLAGYTLQEKVHIARKYLVPRQLGEHGLKPDDLAVRKEALAAIISGYTREAGVRSLERAVGSVARKVARRVAENGKHRKVIVKAASVAEFLGPILFENEVAERTSVAGVATGLAWTSSGGDILFIESTRMPGSKSLTLTGQLGSVMKESARTALSVVRNRSADLGIPAGFFQETDRHLRVPAGAIPKDGPSAGVAMATSLASLLTGRPVRASIAMTGEITLRGKVLPVGGIKEKVLAAHRAGIETVILPARNEKDLLEIPEEVRRKLRFEMAATIDDAWAVALEPARASQASPSPSSRDGDKSPRSRKGTKNAGRRRKDTAAAAEAGRG
jgi:ATP-dependent Lon protease